MHIKKPYDKGPEWHIQKQSQFPNIKWYIKEWVTWYAHYSVAMTTNSIPIAYLETLWQSTYMAYTKPKQFPNI